MEETDSVQCRLRPRERETDSERGRRWTQTAFLRFHSRISEGLSVSKVLNENDSPPSHTHAHARMHASHTHTHTRAENTISKHIGIKQFVSYLIKYP